MKVFTIFSVAAYFHLLQNREIEPTPLPCLLPVYNEQCDGKFVNVTCKRQQAKKMHVAYVATFPLHCFNYFCTLTETSQYTLHAHFGLLTFACYVYERSVILFIVDKKQTWPRCGITPCCA